MSEELRVEAARRLRSLASRMAIDDLDDDGWAALGTSIQLAEDLFGEARADRTRFARGFIEASRHPIAEGSSAVYPDLDFEYRGDLLVAHVRFGPAWEGPPDLVHGGFLAAGFDMVLSSMAHDVLGHSVTRRLSVRYLKPTFTGSALRYEVQAGEPAGRLLELRGRLFADDVLTMRASAQFASLRPERFADRRPAPEAR